MDKNFKLWKKQALEKLDKSTIGGVDEKIQNLCNLINKRDDMFTLSSCSGRVCLLEREDGNKNKLKNIWLYVNHNFAKFDEINLILQDYTSKDKTIEFRQESIIMHICVYDNQVARELMNIAQECGFNHTGIIANKTKIVVEIICDISIICPVFGLALLVEEDYLKYLVEKSNLNLKKGWDIIEKLKERLKQI